MGAALSVAAMAATSGCTPEQVAWWARAGERDRATVTEHVIRSAAEEFGVNPDFMVVLAQCEGGLVDPLNKNPKSSAKGPFQFLDTTWDGVNGRPGAKDRLHERGIDPAPYTSEDRANPVAQARIAANVISEGGLSWWNESRHCWGKSGSKP